MNNLLLLDWDSACFHSESLSLSELIQQMDNRIKDLLTKFNTNYYLMFLTKGKESFRYKIYPEYKANRKGKIYPKYTSLLKEYCIAEYNAIPCYEIEAEDACVLHYNYYKSFTRFNPIICAIDSDLTTIECEQLYNYRTHKMKSISKEEAYYNLCKYIMLGQQKDNIPNFRKGFGESKWNNLYNSFKNIPRTNFSLNLTLLGQVSISYMLGISKEFCGKSFEGYDSEEGKKRFNINYQLMKILSNKEDCKDVGVNYKIYEPCKLNLLF